MKKAIFSITCTTCQTRLAVRTEAAIGMILECPKCQSMVQVVPPEGWSPTPPPVLDPHSDVHAGPPPLDRVADEVLALELDPTQSTLFSALLHSKWFIGGMASSVLVFVLLCWLLWPRPEPESVVEEPELPSKVAAEEPKPKTTVPAKKTESSPSAVEKAIKPEKKPESPTTAVEKKTEPEKQPEPPTPTPLPSSPDAKPVEPNPVPSTPEKENGDAEENAKPEVKKLPPEQVDVAARLADPLPEIELTNMPLADAVQLLAAMGSMPITLDPEAMRQLGVTARDPISLRLDTTTVGKALQEAVSQRGLAVTADDGQVLVTFPADFRETMKKVRYTVSDLTGDDKASADELATLVRKLVAPESWKGNSGQGTIEAEPGALVVVQTGCVHQQVLVFCEKLRKARHKPLRSSDNPERFALTTRLDQAQKMLDRPVTVNYHEPAPLVKVLAYLAKTTKSDILVNHAALAAAETSDRVEATLTVDKKALGASLEDLLRPLGLTYRVVGPNAIQVTTKEAVEERLELEFYPLGPWLDNKNSQLPIADEGPKKNSPLPLGEDSNKNSPLLSGEGPGVRAAKLIERLKAQVAPSTWIDAGGPCEVYFDPPSRCLIVLQSQPAQAAIKRLLESKGEEGKVQGK